MSDNGNGFPPPRRRSRRGTRSLPALINGVLASIGGVYVMTQSISITMIAGAVALLLAGLIIVKG